MRIALLILLVITSVCAADCRRTTRRGLRPEPVVPSEAVVEGDSVDVAEGDFTLAGFEKPLRSRRESFFVTNNTDRDIISLRVRLIYYDLDDRMLDTRTVDGGGRRRPRRDKPRLYTGLGSAGCLLLLSLGASALGSRNAFQGLGHSHRSRRKTPDTLKMLKSKT